MTALQRIHPVPPEVSSRPAANDAQRLAVNTSRWVTISLAAIITGLTEKSIRRKMERGVWLEGKLWRRADGGIFIDMREYEKWVEKAAA